MGKILMIGCEPNQEREQALIHAGYNIRNSSSVAQAKRLIQRNSFSVAILGHSLPEGERTLLARKIRQVSPKTRLVMLYVSSIKNAELADALMRTGTSAMDLLRAIDHLLNMQSRA